MSTINVIVKTLDGRNHDFSVPDNINVLEFKAIIHHKMDIAVERQRLLFQGRVLQDDNLLSSYNVAGNVMHLVTRPPPNQNRTQQETSSINNNDREENSDINRDQIRNILSDVFGNIAELSNPMGVSVNNEGNRVDITVNMPSSNRLSLARLRQNYIHRLMAQARELLANMRDPITQPAPRADRERLYQANAYDLGVNEERLTEVSAQPLPIHNLADMVHSVREMWREAEPQLEQWETVLRWQEEDNTTVNNDRREMQRLHDSASRYVHLFSHMLHIMSDYLVEFQYNANTRVMPTVINRNVATNDTATGTTTTTTNASPDSDIIPPLTGAFGESALPQSETASSTASTGLATNSNDVNDRSRYLYVFSEMPAQLFQVRLDVDSTIQMPVSTTSGGGQTHVFATRTSTSQPAAATATVTAATDPITATSQQSNPSTETQTGTGRIRRQGGSGQQQQFPGQMTAAATAAATTMENLFRSTLHDSFIHSTAAASNTSTPTSTGSSGAGTARHIINGSGSGSNSRTTIRNNGSPLIENVDPYVRCQSRHFQNPSNLRTGAVISTFGGIRFRDSSRNRPRPADPPVVTTATTTTGTTMAAPFTTANTTTNTADAREGDPVRTFIGGLINSIFSSSGDTTQATGTTTNDNASSNSSTTRPTVTTNPPIIPSLPQNDLTRLLQSFTSTGTLNLDMPLGQLFPEIFNNHENDTENNITNQLIQLVINRLTMIDVTQIIHGVYHPLNVLRMPLQDLLQAHQMQCNGSREIMLDHVVMDLESFNRVYMSIFDRLRNEEEVDGLSEDARRNFNENIDINQTINNLNRHHARVVVDMILRSPTDIGFGQLLMNSMFSHHNETLALLDIICNNNEELRQYMVHAFIDSLMTSTDDPNDYLSQFISQSRNTFGLDWLFENGHSRLFRRPEQISELRETVLSAYVVFMNLAPNEIAKTPVVNQMEGNSDQIMANVDSLEDMVDSLAGSIIKTNSLTDVTKPLDGVVAEFMDVCSYQQDDASNAPNGGSWQSVLPPDWIDIVSRDSNAPVDQQTIGIPYSDAYVSGMPPKRRKIILNQRHRSIQPVSELMHDCIDHAIRSAGVVSNESLDRQQFPSGLTNSFQELVSDHVRNRLVEESFNFPSDRFPSVEQNFNRKKRQEEDKNNN